MTERVRRPAMLLAVLVCSQVLSGLAVTGTLAQPVSLHGYFVAEKSCEATRKKDRDNPGNVRLVPKRAYEMRGRNSTPGSHYRIVVPGAPGTDIRWVAMDCGRHTTRKNRSAENQGDGRNAPKSLSESSPSGDPAPGAENARVAALGLQENSLEHVLAVSWQPGFCVTQPRRRECRTMTEDRFDARNFSLHGLWPDDLDDRAVFPCYCNTGRARSCALKLGSVDRIVLSNAIRARMKSAMPGMMSGLHLHEWTKHGSCYERDRAGKGDGTSAEDYFRESLALLEQLNGSPVRELFAKNIGKVVSARQINRTFERAFGTGAGDRVVVRCRKVDGREIVTELWISLGAGISADSNLADLILNAPRSSVSSSARPCRKGLIARAPR